MGEARIIVANEISFRTAGCLDGGVNHSQNDVSVVVTSWAETPFSQTGSVRMYIDCRSTYQTVKVF